MPATLPALDADAKMLSEQLSTLIREEIQSRGNGMSFSRFMELALYAPNLGYYRNDYHKFGKSGDFVTSPEISPLFSYCIANQCAEVLSQVSDGVIIEFGAGSGVMAADILIHLKKINRLPKQYCIIEISAALQSLQHETISKKIPDELHRVKWLNQLPNNPIHGVVLANEVLDAMPVTLFTQNDKIEEKVVTIDRGAFSLKNTENTVLRDCVDAYNIPFIKNYTSEINLQLPGWIKSISDLLSRGLVLLIDYGFARREYYHPDRATGTLMCHYRHYTHPDPFILIGMQDITAHVDFTHVAESADDAGLEVIGFTNQAAFLMNCGLLSFIDEKASDMDRIKQNQQIIQLTSPAEMGELFKVMGLSKGISDAMGFCAMNQLERL